MEAKNEIIVVDEKTIKDKIYIIRGEKVMLDFELAEIYGYETRYFNRQVKNNIEKFEGFMFHLSLKEWADIMMCKNITSSWGGTRKLPYAFTEQGIYMLMTVLRGPLATEQSRRLINIFKNMKDYIVANNNLMTVNEILKLSTRVNKNTIDIKKVKNQLSIVMDNFIDPNKHKEFLILDGNKFEADIAYQTIFKTANSSITIVDDYVSNKTLDLLRVCDKNVEINLYTDDINKQLSQTVLDDFIYETNLNIKVLPSKKIFHDRYIFIDDKEVYISGPSLKDAGNKIGTIRKSNDFELYKPILIKLK